MEGLGNSRDPRILAVQDHRSGGLVGDLLQELRRLVDFPEAVQLVAQHVQQEAVARRDPVDEVHSVGFIKFKYRNVSVEASPPVDLAQKGSRHAAGEVASRAVGEDLQALAFKELHHHLRGGGFAVGSADHRDPVGERGQCPLHEAGIDFLDHQTWKSGASAPEPGYPADELAERNAEGKHAL